MYCGKCGNQNPDGATFCSNCGATLSKAPNVSTGPTAPNTSTYSPAIAVAKKRSPLPLVLGAGVIIVVIVILLSTLTGGRSYEKTIDQTLDSIFSADVDELFDLFPPQMMEYGMEMNGYSQEEMDTALAMAEQMIRNSIDSSFGSLGDDWDYSYAISDETDLEGAELDQIKDSYSSLDVNVSAAKTVDIDLTVTAGELENTDSMSLPLIKVGKSWYLDALNAESLF